MMDRDTLRDWFTRGRIITLSVLFLVMLVGAFTARPAWRAVKTWRAHRFAAEGEVFLSKGQLEPAVRKAQQALQLSSADARVQRLMARVLTRGGHPNVMPFWQVLLTNPRATTTDREEAITAALRAQAWDFAREQLQVALSRPPVPVSIHRLASDYYTAQGDFKQGVNFARQALEAAPTDGTNVLFVTQRLLLTRTAPETTEARTLLDQHANTPASTGAEALVLLALRFENSSPQLEAIIARLRTHPARTLPQEFLAFDLELKVKPDEWARIVATAVEQHAGGSDEALLQLGRWLNRHSEYEAVLRHVPLTRALRNQDLYLVHLDALAGLKRWAEVEQALKSAGAPLDQFYLTLYQVRAQMEQGQKELANVNWTLAHQRAASNAEQTLYLAQYAEKIGAHTEAIRAYRRVSELLPNHRPTLLALLQLVAKHGSTRETRDVVSLIVQRFPEDTSAQNDHAYFNALLGENLEAARQVGELLVKAQPEMLAYRVTLALAWLRSNRAADAWKLLGPLKLDWTQKHPGWRAVFAATLNATGDAAGAKRIADSLPLDVLRPEERALVAGPK
jgi:tetratricopeptide (TPR) repeat protein